MSKKRGVAKDNTCSYHYLMASQVSCSLCVDGVGWALALLGHYLVLSSSGYEHKMRSKISDPSRYENFGVRNILDLH